MPLNEIYNFLQENREIAKRQAELYTQTTVAQVGFGDGDLDHDHYSCFLLIKLIGGKGGDNDGEVR